MSELDEKRRKSFLENIENIQVIITCTEKFDAKNLKFNSFNVINGSRLEKGALNKIKKGL